MKILKKKLIDNFGDDIKDVVLFGSRANGTASEKSDYDILIILNNDYDWTYRDKITDMIYDLELKYNIIFDKHFLSLQEIKHGLRGSEPIYTNAIKNGIYA